MVLSLSLYIYIYIFFLTLKKADDFLLTKPSECLMKILLRAINFELV